VKVMARADCTNHHHACDCREAEFAKLREQNRELEGYEDQSVEINALLDRTVIAESRIHELEVANEQMNANSTAAIRRALVAEAEVEMLKKNIAILSKEAAHAEAALSALLKFHQEGDDGAALPREYWSGDYRAAVEQAEAAIQEPEHDGR